MSRSSRSSLLRSCILLCMASLLFACASEETRTQLTFQISASEALQQRIETLRVVVKSENAPDDSGSFPADALRWPVDIVVIPADGQDSRHRVTVVATALDASGGTLATMMAADNFRPGQERKVAIKLDPGAPDPGDDDDDDDDDEMDAGRDAMPAERDAGPDSAPPVVEDDAGEPPPPENCMTRGQSCDDGKPCNGLERCDPEDAEADADGCVGGESKMCPANQTCDMRSGECTSCETAPDGDQDGARSMTCGGNDCDDNDDEIAPGLDEVCDGKDNDCNGTVDGAASNAACMAMAPRGGAGTCGGVAGCTFSCTNPDYEIVNGVCLPKVVRCPTPDPCAPGTCMPGRGTYSCTCPPTHVSGVGATRCVARGVEPFTIGFETACDGVTATPGTFTNDQKPMAATLYTSCGVTFGVGNTMGALTLIRPTPGVSMIPGLTGMAALVVPNPPAVMNAPPGTAQLVMELMPGHTSVSFDVLDIDVGGVLAVTALPLTAMVTVPPAGATRGTRVTVTDTVPITSITVTYTPAASGDLLFIDQLTYATPGCGDGVMQMGEVCDDGNTVQCDTCDNACSVSVAGCLSERVCLANSTPTPDMCSICDTSAAPTAPGADIAPKPNPAAPMGCN